MLTEDEQIAHADRGPPTITVSEFCKREGLDQKRLLGAMIANQALYVPVFSDASMPSAEALNNPGTLLILDNWQAAGHAAMVERVRAAINGTTANEERK